MPKYTLNNIYIIMNENTIKLLQYSTNDNVQSFTLCNQNFISKCISIYDGDTATFCILLHNQLYKFKMRLSGIDTPEMRPSKKQYNRKLEKKAAIMSRNRLLQLVTDQEIQINMVYSRKEIRDILDKNRKLIYIKCGKCDKYGRCLVKLYDSNEYIKSFNNILVEDGYAYKYYGGKKMNNFINYFRININI